MIYDNININDKIVISFSGGPDSVYLFHKLNEIKEKYNLKLHILYVNHKIRTDVLEDIEFVKHFSKKYNVDYSIIDIDKVNPNENYAREFRYRVLREEKEKLGYDLIATGHNLNDKIETFLFRLIRGSSFEGLCSIKSKYKDIIRPILDEKKEDILKYLDSNNLAYRIDYTNFENNYSRNKIRNIILPVMHEINTNVLNKINELICDIENIYENKNDKSETIKNILKSKNIQFNRNLINDILSLSDNGTKSIEVSSEYDIVNSYGNIYLQKKNEVFENIEIEIKLGEKKTFNNYDILLVKNSLVKNKYLIYNESDYHITKYEIINEEIKKYIETSPLKIRSYKEGDKIEIFNLGHKKVKKIFIDKKINKLKRKNIPLLIYKDKVLLVSNLNNSKDIRKTDRNSQYMILVIDKERSFSNE